MISDASGKCKILCAVPASSEYSDHHGSRQFHTAHPRTRSYWASPFALFFFWKICRKFMVNWIKHQNIKMKLKLLKKLRNVVFTTSFLDL
jgi:hypothetical protein